MAVLMLAGNLEYSFILVITFRNSGAKMDQTCLQNSAGKPSGPGDLLFGMSLRAIESSLPVIGESSMAAWS